MQARARVLMDPGIQAQRRLQATDAVPAGATPQERLGALYGSALASVQLRDWDRAQAAIDQALAVVRNSPHGDNQAEQIVSALQGQLLLARGQPAKALALMNPLADEGSRAGLLLQGQAAVAATAARAPEAAVTLRKNTEALQTWVALHPDDAGAWSQLAQDAEQLGLPLRAVRAEAESRAAAGDLSGAVDRLRAAQRLARNPAPGDFIDASIIDARLRSLERQRRQFAAELRGGKGGGEPELP